MNYLQLLLELGMEVPDTPEPCDVDVIENAVGVRLPESYRLFLKQCGGASGDIRSRIHEPTPFGDNLVTSYFNDGDGVYDLLDSMITPRNMITIGGGHFAKFACLSIAGIDRGSVYALDGECRAYWPDEEFERRYNAMADSVRHYLTLRRDDELDQKPAGYDNIYLLANDFDQFIEGCSKC